MKDKNANTEEVLRKTLSAKGNLDKSVRDDILVKVKAQSSLNRESSRISLKWRFISVGVLVAVLAISVVTIYPALNNRDKPVGERQDVTTTKGELLEDLNSGDIERLQEVLEGSDVRFYSEGIAKDISLNSLLLILNEYEEFNLATKEGVELIMELGIPTTDSSEVYVSNDGRLFIIVNEVGNTYSVTLFSLIEEDVSEHILLEPEEASVEVPEEVSAGEGGSTNPRSFQIKVSPSFTDKVRYIEAGQDLLVFYGVMLGGLSEGDSCRQIVKTYDGNTLVDNNVRVYGFSSEYMDLGPTDFGFTASIDAGRSVFTVECGEFSGSFEVMLVEAPGSVCDDADQTAVLSDITLEEAREQVVGSWVGCAFNPWMPPYKVKLDFFEDSRFATYNIEVDESEYTLRVNAGLYYGKDGEHEGNIFELTELHTNGSVQGEFGFQFDILKLQIQNLGFSEDRNTVYFEVSYLGSEELRYKLERQVP